MIAAALLLAAAAPATPAIDQSKPLTVAEVQARHRELAGKTVLIRGWLSPCGRFDCYITGSLDYIISLGDRDYPKPQRSALLSMRWGGGRFGALGEKLQLENSIPLAGGGRFNIEYFAGYMDVLLEAKVLVSCWDGDVGPNGQTHICAHSSQIEPVKIVRVFRSVPKAVVEGSLPRPLETIGDEPMHPLMPTITALHADPRRYHRKLVRVRGWINACRPLSCALDERPSTDRRGAGKSLSLAANSIIDDALVRARLPLRVVIDAEFNAECLTDHICTDRAPVLGIFRFAEDPTGTTIPTRD